MGMLLHAVQVEREEIEHFAYRLSHIKGWGCNGGYLMQNCQGGAFGCLRSSVFNNYPILITNVTKRAVYKSTIYASCVNVQGRDMDTEGSAREASDHLSQLLYEDHPR